MKKFDLSFLTDEVSIIAGIDEAGRGPLAGPVVAASVVFENDVFIDNVNDSKKLSESKREILFDEIISSCTSYGVGIVDNYEIDKINILQATFRAMKISVENLSLSPDLLLIDGNKTFATRIKTKTIVKGDSKSFSIAAASIIAKVTRDRIMRAEHEKNPEYNWEKNKGYGTKEHILAIEKYGPVNLHRKSFLTNILGEDNWRLFK